MAQQQAAPPTWELPPLPYGYDALEPHIDAETMRIHHDLHHAGYVRGLNTALAALASARQSGDYAAVQALSRQVAFHGGGHYNHSVFWRNMAPAGQGGGGDPHGRLAAQITHDFGSPEAFRAHFSAAANSVEGAGWGVLGWHDGLQRLIVLTMMNQQDLNVLGTEPLLLLDVWEHAYYLKYQNRRTEYIRAWWNVVNWSDVAERFEKAKGPS
jgi:Fe-Mn family superoxide dismutase